MPYIFGKLWHLAIIWAIRRAFQCILQGVRILLANHTRISPTSDNDSYPHNEKRICVCIIFWSGIISNGPKMQIFGPKCQFWAKFGRFWAPNPIFWGQGVKILVPSYRESNETPFSCWKHWSVRLQLAARGENVLSWPQKLDIFAKKSIFLYRDRDFCQWGK